MGASSCLRNRFAELADRVAREKGVPADFLPATLIKAGEAGVPDHAIFSRIEALANEVVELRARLARTKRQELAVFRDRALELIDFGDFDRARSELSRGREAARSFREEARPGEAELLADEARIDHLQLSYRAAAKKYAEAASLVAPFDPEAAWELLMGQGGALVAHGQSFGDSGALTEAIAIYKRALVLRPRSITPLDWAATQNGLGNALRTLGERESGTENLVEAVAAYRAALEERTRDRAPRDWVLTQNNLAFALVALGERERSTERFEQGVAAYREAIKELTRSRAPLEWAGTQNNLGAALQKLGELELGKERLEQAVTRFSRGP